jgi:hypothetical protein
MERHTVGLAAIALAAVVALAVLGAGRPALAHDPCGDANCDGAVNTVDVALILQHHAGLLASLPCLHNADVDLDGSVTSVDAALILQYGAGLITKLPPLSGELRDIPECGPRPELSEAAYIVTEMLARGSSDLFLDREERDALSGELHAALARIREAHPAMADISVKPSYDVGRVALTPDAGLIDAIQALVPDERGLVTFVTGYAGFDDLNARLGLRGIHRLKLTAIDSLWLTLCFDDHLNAPAAVAAYGDLEEVLYAYAGSGYVDGPDIEAMRSGETWYVVFRDAWGDCIMGCIEEELFFFTVAGDQVIAVDESEALADPRFVELVQLL